MGKLTLEQYLKFCQFSWHCNIISRSNLNQMIEMHGFIKLHHECKSNLREFCDLIELMESIRSTLDDFISSHAFLAAEEIAADLEDLGWSESLLVRSIQTLDPGAVVVEAPRRRRKGIPPAESVIVGKKQRSKRKRVSVNALVSNACVSSVSSSSSRVYGGDDAGDGFVPPLPLLPLTETPSPPSSSPAALPEMPAKFEDLDLDRFFRC